MEGEDGCYREKFRNFVAWAEPDPITAFFAFLVYPSTILHPAYRKQFYPKPMIPVESRDSEGVPSDSLASLEPPRAGADHGLSRPTSVFHTTIGVWKILSRSVEMWQIQIIAH